MSTSSSDTRKERVNLLLPSPYDDPELRTALASNVRAERREAIAEIEGLESTFNASHVELVNEICAKLSTGRGFEAAGAGGGSNSFLSMDQLDPRIGPPETLPIFNPYTAVVTVAGPEGADASEAVGSVHKQVSDLVQKAEPTVSHRIASAMDRNLEVEPEDVDYSGRRPVRERQQTDWIEAALEADLGGEIMPWGVDHVGAPKAWSAGASGQRVAVAVIDTGIAPHLDLARPIRGATFIPGSNSYYDDHGHGTHVAGTIAALRGNGRGVVGVAPMVELIAVKVLARDGFSRGDSVALGITWAANNGARVINLSLGSRNASESINRAILHAQARRVVICAAAGNDYGSPVSFPAAYKDVCIAVAATDRNNRRAVFSNVGLELDLAAPGVEIQSTYLGNGYREMQGTSMATPHVSGVAALVLSRYPALGPLEVKLHLERTAIPLGAPTDFGRGLVQADRAVVTPPAPAAPAGGGSGVEWGYAGPDQPATVKAAAAGGPAPAKAKRAPAAKKQQR